MTAGWPLAKACRQGPAAKVSWLSSRVWATGSEALAQRSLTLEFQPQIDLLLPLRGPLGIGGSAEYFDRHTFYQDEARTRRRYHYPQLRAFFTWSVS